MLGGGGLVQMATSWKDTNIQPLERFNTIISAVALVESPCCVGNCQSPGETSKLSLVDTRSGMGALHPPTHQEHCLFPLWPASATTVYYTVTLY